jgi:hypothetical protein
MDVDRIFTLAASKADKAEEAVVFFRTTGPRKSAFEHLVPEQLFSTEEQRAEAISAVKALAIAASQGQKIYTITQANAAQVNELTISAAVKQEITAAINAGKEVTVHQNPITHAGWTGEGYIVIDPETGAGAWKISGGINGGAMYAGTLAAGVGLTAASAYLAFGLVITLTPIVGPLVAAAISGIMMMIVADLYAQFVIGWHKIATSNCAIEKDTQMLTELLLYSSAQLVLQRWLTPVEGIPVTKEMMQRLSIFLITDVAMIELQYLSSDFPDNDLDDCQ